jgi:transcriptional regulator with XRE-family HTH domain
MANSSETPPESTVETNIRQLMRQRGIGGIVALRTAMTEAGHPIGNSTLQRALKGADRNRLESLNKIAAFFDVTAEQLLQPDLGAGLEERPIGSVFDAMTQDEHRLLADFRSLTDEDRSELAAEIGKRAARTRAHVAKVLKTLGSTPAINAAVQAFERAAQQQPVATVNVKTGQHRDIAEELETQPASGGGTDEQRQTHQRVPGKRGRGGA